MHAAQNPSFRPRRVLVKLSGESLCKPGGFGIDPHELATIAGELRHAADAGAQIAVVIGGGNMVRGAVLAERGDIHRATADHLGMLGTIMNAVALREKLARGGVEAVALSAVEVRGIVEGFDRARALAHLDAQRVLILAAGTGNPFFTTDTAAAFRAAELDCDLIVKATKVDGVYDKDPVKHPDALRFDHLTHDEALRRGLGVMDLTAVALCREHALAVRVLEFSKPGHIARVVKGEPIGTLITP